MLYSSIYQYTNLVLVFHTTRIRLIRRQMNTIHAYHSRFPSNTPVEIGKFRRIPNRQQILEFLYEKYEYIFRERFTLCNFSLLILQVLIYFEYKFRLCKATILADRTAEGLNGPLLCHFLAVAVITRTVQQARTLAA